MGKIVQTSDFKGKYKISQNGFSETDLQAFIDKYEKVYIRRLLGITLGDLFYTDIASGTFLPPVTARYTVLFNAIAQELNGCNVISNGVKEMLIGFIYWEYVRFTQTQNTLNGSVAQESETSVQVDLASTPIYDNYNEAIDSYTAVQYYINYNKVDYPEYNGQCLSKAHLAF